MTELMRCRVPADRRSGNAASSAAATSSHVAASSPVRRATMAPLLRLAKRPYVDNVLLHLDIDGLGPPQQVARAGNGQGFDLAESRHRWLPGRRRRRPAVGLARVAATARADSTFFVTASCRPTDGLDLGALTGTGSWTRRSAKR